MKKIKIKENELITLIEKIVNEQFAGVGFGNGFETLGASKPTDKYKDLNIEGDDEHEVSESEIVERLRKRMGPRKFPKKANETISEQTINPGVWNVNDKEDLMDMVSKIYNKVVATPPSTDLGPRG